MFTFKTRILFLLFLFCFQFIFCQNDCSDAIVACGNSNFGGLSATGVGLQELSGSNTCSSQENNSIWLKVTIENSGTLAFDLIPENTDIEVDFDFFIFGPHATCGNLGQAIRCSTTNPQAANQGNNHTGLSNSEIDSSEGPGALGNSFVSSIDALTGETYYIVIDRPIGTSNFSLNWTGTATFSSPPIINNTTNGNNLDITKCDDDGINDNITDFNLSTSSSLAIGSQTNLLATFHTSINDALTNTNSISTPNSFRNSSNPQQIILRLTNPITGCFSTKEINLNVIPFNVNNPIDLHECDLDINGFEAFDLTKNNNLLTNNDSSLSISYHPSNGSSIILPNLYTNQIAFTNEKVWVKITSSNGCFVYKSFNLIIDETPAVITGQLTQCDFQLNPDGITIFDLSQANNILTGGNTNYKTTFFLNTNDAQAGIGEINTSFTNTQNPQIIGVRVTNNLTGCFSITSLTLNVSLNPTTTVNLYSCDNDGKEDGFTIFNLVNAGFETNGNSVTYYESSHNALHEINPISQNYINTEKDSQQIFVRIENGNDCSGINIINLIVDSLPNIEVNDNTVFCLNKSTIPVKLDAGIGLQNPNNFTYHWSPNGETTEKIDIFEAGTYTVTVTNNQNCSKIRTIHVKESDLAVIENIEIMDLNDNNTITVFVQGDETDFSYSLDSSTGPFQDSNYFENVTPGIHNVYVFDKDGCGITNKAITILGAPKFFTPNGDGYHDYWNVVGLSKTYNARAKIHIYNRYGKLLKQISAGDQGWNGTFNGEPQPADDYWYTLELENGRTAKGHFALKR